MNASFTTLVAVSALALSATGVVALILQHTAMLLRKIEKIEREKDGIESELKRVKYFKDIEDQARFQLAKQASLGDFNPHHQQEHQGESRGQSQQVQLRSAEKKRRATLHRVCLTGGPCGGKSTSLVQIKQNFEQLGYTVLLVPEAATLLMTAGVSPGWNQLAFQISVAKVQMALEEAFTILGRQSGNPCIVVCDRGIMDGKAYLTEQQFEIFLDEMKETVVGLRDRRYDAVLHLATAAKGAEDFYTTANNNTRTEPLEVARQVDDKTLAAWVGSNYHFVIDNSTDFPSKIRRVVDRM